MRVVTNILCIILFLNCFHTIKSQEKEYKTPKNQVGIWFDNDFFVLTDRFYTFGLGIEYSRNLDKGIFNNTLEGFRFQLYQKAYTPDDLRTEDLGMMERRYAGFLGFQTDYSIAKKDIFEVGLLLGLIGPSSGSGGFQRWYHDNIVRYVTPTWAHEMPDEYHANISVSYKTEIQLGDLPFGVWVTPTPMVTWGTKDQFVQVGGEIFFGRKSPLAKSMAYRQFGDLEREIYFSFSWNHRWVERNVLVTHDIPGFQQTPRGTVRLFSVNVHHRHKVHEYRFSYDYISREADNLVPHKWVGVSYVRSF